MIDKDDFMQWLKDNEDEYLYPEEEYNQKLKGGQE